MSRWLGDAGRGLAVVRHLALLRPVPLAAIDGSVGAARRSLLIPLTISLALAWWQAQWVAQLPQSPFAGISQGELFVNFALSLVLPWICFLLLMQRFGRLLGAPGLFAGYVWTYNWATMVQAAVVVPVMLLRTSATLGPVVLDVLAIMVQAWGFTFAVLVLMAALQVRAVLAIGFALLEFLLSASFGQFFQLIIFSRNAGIPA